MTVLARYFMKYICVFILLLFSIACNQQEPNAQGEWLKGTEQEKINAIEKQFRGFDNAMVETGYRYQELYWAGQDQNWEYANYQLGKIKLAIENGLTRRPKRAESSEFFLSDIIPEMQKAIVSKDTLVFNQDFNKLTTNCNNCHAKEKVSYFTVKTPTVRQSPIRK